MLPSPPLRLSVSELALGLRRLTDIDRTSVADRPIHLQATITIVLAVQVTDPFSSKGHSV
jgi:uncharacterized membrane protein YhaH (DUF805 family)